jgi:hypothetical protein
MYLLGTALGTDGSSEAPLPSEHTEFSDPIEASLVAQFAAFRQASELDEERQERLHDAHGLLAGFIGGAAAGFFSSREVINIIRNANRRT